MTCTFSSSHQAVISMIHILRHTQISTIFTICLITLGALLFSCIEGSFVVRAQSFSALEDIQNGDLIRVDGTYDVYVIKLVGEKRFKRLILSPEIFNSYNSFDWNNVKTISRSDMDFFVWSDLIMREDGDRRLYRLFPQQRDNGVKSQVQLSSPEFVEAGGDWDSIFQINEFEFAYYTTIQPITKIIEFKSGAMFLMMGAEQDNQEDAGINPPEEAPTEPDPPTPEPTQNTEGTLSASRTSRVANNQKLIMGESKTVLGFEVQAQDSANNIGRVDIVFTAQGTSNHSPLPWASFESISLVDLDQNNQALQTIRLSSRAHIASEDNSYTYRFQGFQLVVPQDGIHNLGVVVTAKPDLEQTHYQPWSVQIPQNGVRGMDGIGIKRYAPQEAFSRSFVVRAPVGDVIIRGARATEDESTMQHMQRNSYTDNVELLRFDIANKGQIDASFNELKVNITLSHNNAKTLNQVMDALVLYQGSSEVASIQKQDIPQIQAGTVIFSFRAIHLRASTTQTFTLKVRMMPQADNYPEGLRIQASIGDAPTNQLSFSYEDGRADTASGSSVGMPRQMFVVYPQMVGAMRYSIERVSRTQNQARAQFEFMLKAIGGDIYLSDVCEMMGGSRASFIFQLMRGAGTSSLDCALTTTAREVQDRVYKIKKNATENFTLSVRFTSHDNPVGAFFAVRLREIRWSVEEQEMFVSMDSYEVIPEVVTNGVFLITPTNSIAPPTIVLDQVTNVTVATGNADTLLDVRWDPVEDATIYDVWYCVGLCVNDGDWTNQTSATTSKQLASLSYNTPYKVRVRARNASTVGDWSSVTTATTSVTLTKVSNVVASTGTDDTKLSVSFDAQTKATSYEIEYRTSSSAPSGSWTSVTATTSPKELTGLTRDTEYQVRVRAKITGTTGNWSDTATKTTSFTLTLPLSSAPTVSLVDKYKNSRVTVVWNAVTNATGYDIQYKKSTQQDSEYVNGSSTNRGVTITGLDTGTSYDFRYRAKATNNAGNNIYSAWSDVATKSTSPLAKVNGVSPSNGTDDTKISVSWTTQSNATSYDIEYRTSSSAPDGSWTSVTASTSPKELTGLSYNTEYQVRVRAKTATITGDWSDTATHTTSLTLVKVTGVSISTGTDDTKLSVSWTTQSKATSYEVTYRETVDQGEEENQWTTVTSNTSPKVLTGLTHDTAYQVSVRAKATGATGAWSDIATKTTSFTLTLPSSSAPTVELVDGHRDSRVTVVWTAVTNATGYDIQYKKSTQQDSEYVNGSSTNRGVTITGLDGHTSYDFRYRAKATNNAGTTIYSAWSDVATKSTDFVVAQTANLQASVASSTVVHLTWDDVNNAANHHIQHCKVTNTETCGSTTTAWSDHSSTPTASQVSYTDLTPATTYKFRVRGKATHNSQTVHGAWSGVISATTHSQLGKAVISSVAAQSSASLKVDWNTVTNATGYIVEHKTGSNAWTKTTISSGSATTATLTGLSAETQYSVRVKATTTATQVSNGHWSDTTTATTRIAKTSGLSYVSQTNSHIKIQWTQVGSHLAYQIRYKKNQGAWSSNQSHSCSGSCSTISYGLADRVAGTRYDIQVRAKTSSNVGDWSDTLTYTTPLSTVSITSTSKTDSSVTLNWSAVGQATSYEYEHKASSDSNWSTTKSVTTTTVTISSLDENTTYKVRVRAKNARTTGDWSDESSISTDLTFTASAILTVSQGTDDTKLSVSWTTQTRATGYDIAYRKASTAPDGSWSSVTTQTFPKVINNLTANTNVPSPRPRKKRNQNRRVECHCNKSNFAHRSKPFWFSNRKTPHQQRLSAQSNLCHPYQRNKLRLAIL